LKGDLESEGSTFNKPGLLELGVGSASLCVLNMTAILACLLDSDSLGDKSAEGDRTWDGTWEQGKQQKTGIRGSST
jgi:hypothetical protein